MVNQDDYRSEGKHPLIISLRLNMSDFRLNHHLWWGKLYRAAEVKPDWRRPSDKDIDMALEVIALADACLTRLDGLLEESKSSGDKVWSNDFCRNINAIDRVLRGTHSFVAEIESLKTGGVPAES